MNLHSLAPDGSVTLVNAFLWKKRTEVFYVYIIHLFYSILFFVIVL